MAQSHEQADGRRSPFPDGSTHGFFRLDATRGAAARNGDADLDVRDLTVDVPRHEALPRKFHAVHPLTGRVIRGMISGGSVSTRLRR